MATPGQHERDPKLPAEEDSALLENKWSSERASSFVASSDDEADCRGSECGFISQNSARNKHLALCIRVAAVTVMMVAPFVVKKGGTSPILDRLRESGVIIEGGALMYMFNIYLTTGQTMQLAKSAIVGTFLVVFNMWVLEGYFPGGIKYHWDPRFQDHAFYAVVADGVLFVLLVLFLPFELNTRIFALSSFVYNWMRFLNPDQHTGFSHSFQIDFAGTEFKEFEACTTGCMLAILTTMLPTPFFARDDAILEANRMVQTLCVVWLETSGLVFSDESDDWTQDKAAANLASLKAGVGKLGQLIEASGWEVFCRPRARRRRCMLARLQQSVLESYDRVYHCWHTCLVETYGETHVRLMSMVEPSVESLVAEANGLLGRCTAAACVGYLSDHDLHEIEEGIASTKAAVAVLTQSFHQAKAAVGLPGVSKDLLEEHCFCLSVSAYGRIAFTFAEDLVQHQEGTKRLPSPAAAQGPNIFSREHWNFVFRNCLTILCGMYIGYHGYYKRFKRFDAGIAGTSAIILSEYMGSAMTMNVQRLQGVIIGTIGGQVGYGLLGWCNWYGYLATLGAIFMMVAVCFFIYFHLPRYGTMAFLLAIYGTKNLASGCSDDATDPTTDYYNITNHVVALFLTIVIDQVFRGKSARALAALALQDAGMNLLAAVGYTLGANAPVVCADLGAAISRAKALGQEARMELVFLSEPFRSEQFDSAVSTWYDLRVFLKNIEYSAAEGADGGRKATQLKSFGPLRDRLLDRLALLQERLAIFTPRLTSQAQAKGRSRRSISGLEERQTEQELEAFIVEANALAWDMPAQESLEKDAYAQVSVLLTSVLAMMRELRSLHRELLK